MSSLKNSNAFPPASSDENGHIQPEPGTHPVNICQAFSTPGNVVLKTVDNVIFRVEDFHLKAAR